MWWTAAFALLAAPGRIVPYLEPGEQPLRPSEAAVRFVNVPAAAFRPIPEAENAAAGARAWRVAPDEAVAVVQLGAQLLEAARRAGVRFPRGSLKPPYHADSSADCCACAIEDPAWTRAPPAGEWQPGGAGWRPIRACETRVPEPPYGRDEVVIDCASLDDPGNPWRIGAQSRDPMSRFNGDWEADFVGGSGAGRKWQKGAPRDDARHAERAAGGWVQSGTPPSTGRRQGMDDAS